MRKNFSGSTIAALLGAAAIVQTPAVVTTTQAQTLPAPFDKAVKQEVVTKTGAAITDRYIYPDRALQAKAKIDAALAAGDYDAITATGR